MSLSILEIGRNFINGNALPDDLVLSEEVLEKLGLVTSQKKTVLDKLVANKIETWRGLLVVGNEGKLIELVGEVNGLLLQGSIKDYIKRRKLKEDELSASAIKRLKKNIREYKDGFLAALPTAKRMDGALRLEHAVHITHDWIVFERDCYRRLYPIVLDSVRLGGKSVVTGTPGIGKSFFGYYAAFRFLEEGITVIYIDLGWDWTNLYVPNQPSARVRKILSEYGEPQPDGPWAGRLKGTNQGLTAHSRELYGALTSLVGDVVVVLDPPKTFGTDIFNNPECGLLVVTSPSQQRIASFCSFGEADKYFMPIWSKDELLLMLGKRKGGPLSDVEINELGIRFLRFGGIPRTVARPDCDHATMVSRAARETNYVISNLGGTAMKDMLDTFSVNPQYSGRIIHLIATESFEFAGKQFATEMIERQILVRYWRRSRQDLLTLINSASGVSGFASSLGRLNEMWWHVALQEGVSVRVIQLFEKPARNSPNTFYYPGEVREVHLPATASRYSAKQNLSDISRLWDLEKDEQGIYIHFLKGNVPLVDSISVVPGETGKDIFGFESPIPDSPATASVKKSTSSSNESDKQSEESKKARTVSVAKIATQASAAPGARPPCVMLNQMTLNVDHSSDWKGFVELVNLVRRLTPIGTSIHFCWVTSESCASNFTYKFPSNGHPDFVHQVPQWLVIIADKDLARFTSA